MGRHVPPRLGTCLSLQVYRGGVAEQNVTGVVLDATKSETTMFRTIVSEGDVVFSGTGGLGHCETVERW